MINISRKFTLILMCIGVFALLTGCKKRTEISETIPSSETKALTGKELYMSSKRYFTMEDFAQLTIGESTLSDLCDTLCYSDEEMYVMFPVLGGMAIDYPMEDGRYIRVVLGYGAERIEDVIISKIEIVDETVAQGTVCVNPNEKFR